MHFTDQHGKQIQWNGVQQEDYEHGKVNIISALQAKKAIRRKEEAFWVYVTEVLEESSTNGNDKAKTFLQEYADVFPDELPKELPPIRAVDHKIELEPGATPPSRPT